MATAFFIQADSATFPTPSVERFFVYNPAGVAAGNVYTDWATMFAAIALLPIGEMPVVSVVGAGVALPVPAVGMPVNGWDMRGGSIVSYHRATGLVTLDVPDGVLFDMLFEIGNGLTLQIQPALNTGVLNFSLLPDGGPFVFVIGIGCVVSNQGLGALMLSRGIAMDQGTYILAMLGATNPQIFGGPASTGPMIQLQGDDGAVFSFVTTLGGLPIAPAASPIKGGGLTSGMIVITDASGTLPSEWSAGFTGGGAVSVFFTARNGLQGTTALRPTTPPLYTGTMYFDTDVGFPIWWNGLIWVDAAGAPA